MSSNQIHVPGSSGAFDPSDVQIVIAVSSAAGPILIVILKNGDQVYIWDTPEARAMLRAAGLTIFTIKNSAGNPEPEEALDTEENNDPPAPRGGHKMR
jgi:hypothetical protein